MNKFTHLVGGVLCLVSLASCCKFKQEITASVTNESHQKFYLEQWNHYDTSLTRGYYTANLLGFQNAIYIMEASKWAGEMGDCNNVFPYLDSLVIDLESDSLQLNIDINNCDSWSYSETTEGRCGTDRGRWYLIIKDSHFDTIQ